MKSPICDMLGIEFPLLAFSHCRDVVAAVSRAGGFGVLGATAHSPDSLEQELRWIDDHVDGKPYGIDVLIPENISTAGEKNVTWKSLEARDHAGASRLHARPAEETRHRTDDDRSRRQPAAAVRRADARCNCSMCRSDHPIRLIANALGVPPKAMIEMGKTARRAGGGAGRRQGARDPPGRGRRRYSRGAGHRGRRPLRRGLDHGAGAGGDQGDQADPRRAGARRRRHHDRAADGGLHGDGRGRRVDRIGVAGDGRNPRPPRSSARR